MAVQAVKLTPRGGSGGLVDVPPPLTLPNTPVGGLSLTRSRVRVPQKPPGRVLVGSAESPVPIHVMVTGLLTGAVMALDLRESHSTVIKTVCINAFLFQGRRGGPSTALYESPEKGVNSHEWAQFHSPTLRASEPTTVS